MRSLPHAILMLATAAAAAVVLSACDGDAEPTVTRPKAAPRDTEVVRLSAPRQQRAAEPEDAIARLTADAELTEPLLEALIEATRLRHSDAGVGEGEGLQQELSRLPELRKLARVLRIDALRRADLGEANAAAARVVAIIHVSAITARGDLLVTKLVAIANLQLAAQTIIELQSQDLLTPGGRARITTALGNLRADDPFDARDAVADELELIASSLSENLIAGALTGGPVADEQRARTAAELECLGPAFVEAWDGADPITDLQRLEASTDDDLARRLMPGVAGFRVQYERARVGVVAALAELTDDRERAASAELD